MGETKAGKTTLIATAAEYLYEQFGKILVLYTAELGGFSARVEQRIRQGLIRPFRMRTRDDEENSLSFETLQLSSKGYMPVRFLNALEGEVEQGVPMVGPTTTIYEQTCGDCGQLVVRTRFKSKIKNQPCPHCKKPVTLQSSRVTQTVKQTAGFEMIGSLGFDGLTSFSDWYLQDMSHRKNLEGEKAALGGEIESGSITFRGNNRSQVGMAQTRVHELVANSLGIPNLEIMPFWTAISHESSDDTGRLTIVGPKLAGDAKTYIASSWFGNVVEAQVMQNDKGQYTRRLWVSQFYDENNRRHLCGHRGDPRFMDTYFEDAPYTDTEPPTEICTGFSLNFFLQQLEQSIQKGMAADTFGDGPLPGTASIPTTYGEDSETAPAATPTTPAGPRTASPRARPSMGKKSAAAPAVVTSPEVVGPVDPANTTEVVHEMSVTLESEPEQPTSTAAEALAPDTTVDEPEQETPAPEPPPTAPAIAQAGAASAIAAPGISAGAWARPAGTRPPAPKAPQAGPKPPARAPARPMQAVKPS